MLENKAAKLPSTVLSEPAPHWTQPTVEPTMLAAESAMPTDMTPQYSTKGEGGLTREPG